MAVLFFDPAATLAAGRMAALTQIKPAFPGFLI